MIKRIIDSTLQFDTHHDHYRKAYFLLTTVIVLIFILTFFTYFNLFIKPLFSVALLDGAMLLFSIGCLYLLVKKKDIEVSAIFLTMILFVLTSLFIADQKNNDFALAYGVVFPIAAIYLNGIKKGAIFSAFYFLGVLSVAYLGIDVWEAVPFTSNSFINLLVVYAVVILLVVYYEISRLETYKAMQESNLALEKLSSTDALTGLFNRRYINKMMLELYTEAQDKEIPFSVLLLDIDDFKMINDTYGHTKGDRVLKAFSKILVDHTDTMDIVGRWGGEEFLVLCPNTIEAKAHEIAKTLLEEISKGVFEVDQTISASIGVTQFKGSCTFETLVSRVDTAMYSAKNSGKNKIVVI